MARWARRYRLAHDFRNVNQEYRNHSDDPNAYDVSGYLWRRSRIVSSQRDSQAWSTLASRGDWESSFSIRRTPCSNSLSPLMSLQSCSKLNILYTTSLSLPHLVSFTANHSLSCDYQLSPLFTQSFDHREQLNPVEVTC